MSETVETLGVKVENHENRISKVEEKIEDLPVIEKLLEQQIESNKSQNETLGKLDKTLTEVCNTMVNMSDNQKEMKTDIEGLQENIKGLQDERNINIVKWLKDNWLKLVLGGYVLWDFLKGSIVQ